MKRGRGILGDYCFVLRNAESLGECVGRHSLVPQVGCPTLRVGTGSKCGSCKSWEPCFLLCSPVPFGTGHEGASWPACFLFSFSPSLPVHSSPPAICSRFSWHCSWRVQYFFWPTEGEGRCLRVRQNLTCALLGFVIHNIQTKTWNLSALNFGLGQIFLWLCSLHLPLLSNTQSPLVAQKPGTFYSPGSDS